MNIIEVKNMSKNFKKKKLYNDFSLDVLPEPFGPTIAWTVLASISNEKSL